MAAPPKPQPEFIGSATMDPDGTIVLNLRAESDDGDVGIGQLRYPLTHPQYLMVFNHLGGLAPGDRVPVRPFPPDPPPPEPPTAPPPKPRPR